MGQAEVTFDYPLKVAVDRNPEAVRKVAGQRVQDDVDVAADVELRIRAKKVVGCPAHHHLHPVDAEAEIRHLGGEFSVLARGRDVKVETSVAGNALPADPGIRNLDPHRKRREAAGTLVITAVAECIDGERCIGAQLLKNREVVSEIPGYLIDGGVFRRHRSLDVNILT